MHVFSTRCCVNFFKEWGAEKYNSVQTPSKMGLAFFFAFHSLLSATTKKKSRADHHYCICLEALWLFNLMQVPGGKWHITNQRIYSSFNLVSCWILKWPFASCGHVCFMEYLVLSRWGLSGWGMLGWWVIIYVWCQSDIFKKKSMKGHFINFQ